MIVYGRFVPRRGCRSNRERSRHVSRGPIRLRASNVMARNTWAAGQPPQPTGWRLCRTRSSIARQLRDRALSHQTALDNHDQIRPLPDHHSHGGVLERERVPVRRRHGRTPWRRWCASRACREFFAARFRGSARPLSRRDPSDRALLRIALESRWAEVMLRMRAWNARASARRAVRRFGVPCWPSLIGPRRWPAVLSLVDNAQPRRRRRCDHQAVAARAGIRIRSSLDRWMFSGRSLQGVALW